MIGVELAILKFLEGLRTEWLTQMIEWLTMLGEETFAIILIVILYFAVNKELAHQSLFATLTSLAGNSTVKNLVKRPRPFFSGEVTCVRPETATGYSFPSGHTQNFATWSSALALALKKNWLLALSIILTLFVAFSRVFLGVHFPSDVLVGALFGFSASFLCNRLYQTVSNKVTLYLSVAGIFSPFAVYFMACPDPLYEDFFKCFGMVLALAPTIWFEQKYVSLAIPKSPVKKIFRVLIALLVALAIKKAAGLLVFQNLRLTFLAATVSYGILVFTELGVCSYCFKKLKL